MLEVVHAVIESGLRIDCLVYDIECVDATTVDLHQTVAPCIDSIVDGIIQLFFCLCAVIVGIVAHLCLLYIKDTSTTIFYSEESLCSIRCTLCLHNNFGPLVALCHPCSVGSATFNRVSREVNTEVYVPVCSCTLCPERDGIFRLRVNFEIFNDIYVCRIVYLKYVLTIVFHDFGSSLINGTSVVSYAHLIEVNSLAFNIVNRDFDRSSKRAQPIVGLVGIGKERTSEHLSIYFLYMIEKVAHIKEIHNTLCIDDGARHQCRAESDIVEVGDGSGMSQFLLVEIRHLEHSAKRHVGELVPVDVRLYRTKVLVGLNERRIGLSTEIVCHIIVGTGNSKRACRQHQETVSKKLFHNLSLLFFYVFW